VDGRLVAIMMAEARSRGVTGWGTHSLDQVQAALGASLTGELKYANETVLSPQQELIKDHQQLGGISYGTNGRIRIIRGRFHLSSLTRDPKAEKFADNEANKLISRERRPGYELPKIV
jgi:hypothetical protein